MTTPACLKRDPRGHFIWRGEALFQWLPTLLDAASHDPVETAIKGCIRFCERRIANSLEIGARLLRDEQVQDVDADVCLHSRNLRTAELWEKRRTILVAALRQIREVKP